MATWKEKARYEFDNLMARGTMAQVGLLAVLSFVLIGVTGLVITAFGLGPADRGALGPGSAVWVALLHTFDAGTIGGSSGSPGYLAALLFITMGGIFVLSALIGVLNNGIENLVEELRKGRSLVVERKHTVILGFTPKIHTILGELAEANANVPGACVVVLADRDKVEMDDEIRDHQEKRLKVVTRSGSALSPVDLEIVNPGEARSIIVLSPEADSAGNALSGQEADTVVLKCLLALSKVLGDARPQVVAELRDKRTLDAARIVVGGEAGLVLTPPLVSRLLVQTGRQSGLSMVYTELLDFAGCEIYLQEMPSLEGRTFKEILSAFDDSSVMGVFCADGSCRVPPDFSYALQKGDRVIAISEDDDTVVANGRAGAIVEGAIVASEGGSNRAVERTLVLGASDRLALVLEELDPYLAPGSVTVVLGEDPLGRVGGDLAEIKPRLQAMEISFTPGDMTDRAVLDRLDVPSFDHVLVLSEQRGRSLEVADARTMLTLLHLRDIMRKAGKHVPVTSEILDVQNRELAAVAEADDFVVSNTLVSLYMAQISENPHLRHVFEELIRADGYETYLKPVSVYLKPGVDMDFYTVVEAAARRNEVAIGYRLLRNASDSGKAFGVVVNPRKSDRVRFEERDRIIVLALD